jgi:hypothetical protein
MVIKNIKYFEFTKIFKKEILNYSENYPALKEKINECILDFQENKFLSKYYRKPLKNGEFKNFDIHELQI